MLQVFGSRPFRRHILAVAACLLVVSASFWQAHGARGPASRPLNHTPAVNLSTVPKTKAQPKPPKIAKITPVAPVQPEPTYWQGPIDPLPISVGSAPVLYKVPTAEPVVFLGIDDGVVKSPVTQAWLVQHKLPFSLFLYNGAIKNDYSYFLTLQNAGMTVEDHTLDHPDLTKLTLAQQQAQICGTADTYQAVFGRRPTLFRPPYGLFNDLTRQAATNCGMKAIILWRATVDGGMMHFQTPSVHLEAGDIVLMHFRADFPADIQAFMTEVNSQHLQVARLEDWIQ